MKKIIALIAAAAFVLSLATMAPAAHQGRSNLKTTGYLQTSVGGSHGLSEGSGDFTAGLRLRQYFDYMASENLKAVVGYEFDSDWGSTSQNTNNNPGMIGADIGGDGFSGDNDGQNFGIAIQRAMLQFTLPGSEAQIKSGIQYISLPGGAIGVNPVLAGDAAGITMSSPVSDTMDLTLGWTRAMDTSASYAGPGIDAFFASLPIKQDGFSVSPYASYAIVGKYVDQTLMGSAYYRGFDNMDSGYPDLEESANVYWVGTSFDVTMMYPVAMRGSLIYGSMDTDKKVNERAGWYADLSMKYKMEQMTPEVFGWYASGEDDDTTDGSETMPFIYNDAATSKAPSFLVGDMTYLGITSKGVEKLQSEPAGLWCAGVALNHISLTKSLTGTLMAAYYQGTSDKENGGLNADGESPLYQNMGIALTEEDSAWEVTVSSNYEIYENLSAIMEAGYGAADYDEDVWGDDYKDESAHQVAGGLRYNF